MKLKQTIFGTLFLLAACGGGGSSDGFEVDYEDQDLQGEIHGTAFLYLSGKAEVSGDDLVIQLGDTAVADICAFGADLGTSIVMTEVPNAVQANELSLSLSGGESQLVTLYDGTSNTNYIASEGEIEILSLSSTTVTGRMHVKAESNSIVNGNFTATICP